MKTSDVIKWLVDCLSRDGDKPIKEIRVVSSISERMVPHSELEIEYGDGMIEGVIDL